MGVGPSDRFLLKGHRRFVYSLFVHDPISRAHRTLCSPLRCKLPCSLPCARQPRSTRRALESWFLLSDPPGGPRTAKKKNWHLQNRDAGFICMLYALPRRRSGNISPRLHFIAVDIGKSQVKLSCESVLLVHRQLLRVRLFQFSLCVLQAFLQSLKV